MGQEFNSFWTNSTQVSRRMGGASKHLGTIAASCPSSSAGILPWQYMQYSGSFPSLWATSAFKSPTAPLKLLLAVTCKTTCKLEVVMIGANWDTDKTSASLSPLVQKLIFARTLERLDPGHAFYLLTMRPGNTRFNFPTASNCFRTFFSSSTQDSKRVPFHNLFLTSSSTCLRYSGHSDAGISCAQDSPLQACSLGMLQENGHLPKTQWRHSTRSVSPLLRWTEPVHHWAPPPCYVYSSTSSWASFSLCWTEKRRLQTTLPPLLWKQSLLPAWRIRWYSAAGAAFPPMRRSWTWSPGRKWLGSLAISPEFLRTVVGLRSALAHAKAHVKFANNNAFHPLQLFCLLLLHLKSLRSSNTKSLSFTSDVDMCKPL